MRRILKFEDVNDEYRFIEEGKVVLSINKQDKKLDVKTFYTKLFENYEEDMKIEFVSEENLEKESKRIFDTIKQLVDTICERLEKEILEFKNNQNMEGFEEYTAIENE